MGREPINKKRNKNKYLSAEELFTDREEPRKAFWNLYDAMLEGQSEVMTYYGVGGIGKTSILKKLCRELEEKTSKKVMPNYAFFSFDGGAGKEDFLFSLSRQMMLWNNKLSFPLFDTALKKIAIDGGKNWDKFIDGVKETFTQHPLVDAALNIGGQFIPGFDTAAKIVDWLCTQASHKITEKEKQSGENSYLYNEIKDGDSKELKEKLHEYFYEDISDAMSEINTKYVVFIDGYEKYVNAVKDSNLFNGIDNWIMEYMANISNMFLVIGGREKLNWDETILPKNQQHRIGDLSEIDAALFLNKVGIYDCELISGLYKLTNGTPAYLDICKNVYCNMPEGVKPSINDFGKDTSALVRRYLEEMDPGDKNIMIMISYLPTVWDKQMAEMVAKKIGYEAYLDNLDKLIKLSLFEQVDKGIKMHETSRIVIRDAHRDRQERIGEAIIQYFVEYLLKTRASMDYLQKCLQFVEVMELCEKEVISGEDILKILDDITEELEYTGDYINGELVLSSMADRIKKIGYNSEVIVTCDNYRCANLIKLGKYEEAKKLADITLEISKEEFGINNSLTLKVKENIANICIANGDYGDAEANVELIYNQRRDLLGENNWETIISEANMAEIYASKGDYKNAIIWNENAYGKMEKISELDAIRILANLAGDYLEFGDIKKAKEKFKEVHEKMIDVLGEEHPDTIQSNYNLLMVHINSEDCDFEYVKKELRKVCEQSERILGEEHPSTVLYLETLFKVYVVCGDYENAIEIYLPHKFFEQRNDEKILDMLSKVAMWASAYSNQKYYIQALGLHEQSYKKIENYFGKDNKHIILALCNIANTYFCMDDYDNAEKRYNEAYDVCMRNNWGADNQYTILVKEQMEYLKNVKDK